MISAEREDGLLSRALAEIDRDELADLVRDLVAIPSPTGDEREVGEFIFRWLRDSGFEVLRQEAELGRYNIVGILRGAGRGASLTYNSHMDTPLPASSDDLQFLGGVRPAFDPGAKRDEKFVYGRGSLNDKGPLGSWLMAARALKRSGVALRGDLYLAAVIGEVGAVAVGPFEGSRYRGKGIGTRFLLTRGIVTDFAIVAESTSFGITWALPGSAWVRITLHGDAVYTPYTMRDAEINERSNAIVRAAAIVNALEHWAVAYEERSKYRFEGGEIHPKVNIGSIAGGLVFKPNYSPATCDIFVDVRIPPGVAPLSIRYELQDLLDDLKLGARAELILSQRGYEGRNASGLVSMVSDAYRDVFGKAPEPIKSIQTSQWNDLNIYSEQGIIAVKCGPGRPADVAAGIVTEDGVPVEHQAIDQLVLASRLYAAAALRICNQDRLPR